MTRRKRRSSQILSKSAASATQVQIINRIHEATTKLINRIGALALMASRIVGKRNFGSLLDSLFITTFSLYAVTPPLRTKLFIKNGPF